MKSCIFGLSFFLCFAPLFAQEFILQVKSAYTGEKAFFAPAEIWIKEGKIIQIGQELKKEPHLKIINASNYIALPGFVSAAGFSSHERESPLSFNWDQQALDGVDLFRPISILIQAGITTTYFAPGNARMINGFGTVVKTGGKNRVLRERVDLHLHLSEKTLNAPNLFNPPIPATPSTPISPRKPQIPTSRMSVIYCLQELFELAQKNPNLLPITEKERQTLLSWWQSGGVVRLQTEDLFYFHHGTRLAKAFGKIIYIERSLRVTPADDEMKSIPQILTFSSRWNDDASQGERDWKVYENFCLAPDSSEDASKLFQEALNYKKKGLTGEQCLALITANPAKMLGVDARVGTLSAGKDADIVLLTPQFEIARVYLDGEIAYEPKPLLPSKPIQPQKDWILLRGALLHTLSQGSFVGDMLIGNGKILQIAKNIQIGKTVSTNVPILELKGKVVVPGGIDPFCLLGQTPSDERGSASYASNGQDLANQSALDRCRLDSTMFQEMRKEGVLLNGIVSPENGYLSGTGGIVLNGEETTIFKENAFYVCSVTSGNPVEVAQNIQKFIQDARNYEQAQKQYEKDIERYKAQKTAPGGESAKKPNPPNRNLAYERWNLFEKNGGPLVCEADTVPQIRAALKYLRKETSLPILLFPATEARLIPDEILEHRAGILMRTTDLLKEGNRYFPFLEMQQAGIKVIFGSFAGQSNHRLKALWQDCFQAGIDPLLILKSATLDSATLLNIEERVGSLEIGKEANFLILSGEPFRSDTFIEAVYLYGKKIKMD